MSDAFGELFTFNEPGITINIPVAGTFVKWTSFSSGLGGPSDLVQVDAANDRLLIGTNGAGVYRAAVTASYTGSVNILVHIGVFLNGVRQTKLEIDRQLGAAADIGASAINGFISLAVGDDLDIRFTTDVNNRNITIGHLDFNLHALVRAL